MITPSRNFDSESIELLIPTAGTTHLIGRESSSRSFAGRRVLHFRPDRECIDALWGVTADAIAVVEFAPNEAIELINTARPTRLFHDRTVETSADESLELLTEILPDDVSEIFEFIAKQAAGYSPGMKWNEEARRNADMMKYPDRWKDVTVEQVRAKCQQLKMRPKDVDTVTDLLKRRKQGRRFNVTSYRFS